MDYLAGGSLADRLRHQGAIGWQEVLEIAVKVAGGLETAHRAGVLHRDLKPENILVSGYGEPKLADFGIASVKGGTATSTAALTGSIAHAAPELFEGAPSSVRSDVYGLGSTLFMLLAGRAAFTDPADESFLPALARISRDPVPDLRPVGVPDRVCQVVERLMAKQPDERYGSAEEVAVAVRGLQRGFGLAVTTLVVGDPAGDSAAAWPADDGQAASRSDRRPTGSRMARSRTAGALGGTASPTQTYQRPRPPPPLVSAAPPSSGWPARRVGLVVAGVLGILLLAGAGTVMGIRLTTPQPTTLTLPEPETIISPTPTSAPTPTPTLPPPVCDPKIGPENCDTTVRTTVFHPLIEEVTSTFQTFIDDINERRYGDAFQTRSPRLQRAIGIDRWIEEHSTTTNVLPVIESVTDVSGDELRVVVTFTSIQAPEYGPIPGQTCSLWELAWRMIRVNDQWLIDGADVLNDVNDDNNPPSCE